MLDEIVSLRGRLAGDLDSGDGRVQAQRTTLTGFADALQAYLEPSSSSLPEPPADGSVPE